VKDGKGQVTTYIYDKANRLTETKFADSTKHTFQYDKAGNLTNYGTPDVLGTITYDSAIRKTQETVVIGSVTKTYGYSYDSKGNKATFTSPEGVAYSYTYNKNDQLKTITTPVGQIVLEYNWVRNTKVTMPNGVVTDYSFNENNWLTNIAALKQTNPVFTAGYDFDKIGNIARKADNSYGYDKTYQLINSTNTLLSEAFTYDKVGNRKTKQGTPTPWTFNKNNELLTADTVRFGYDDNGNTTSTVEGGATTTFVYGVTDRLQSVQLPDGRTATYTYDPFGRRVKKQVGSESTIYIYADEGLIGEYSGTGVNKKAYGWRQNGIWGTNPVFQIENVNYYFYHNDHLGTPQTMTDLSGDTVWKAKYEAFGEADIDPDSTITNNLRFPGQYFDEETGNHYNWNRYYDPGTGRYVEKDPLSYLAGDENLYRYVNNRTLGKFDNLGLETEEERKNANAKVLEYVEAEIEFRLENPGKTLYKLGAKGNPGEYVDCSGLSKHAYPKLPDGTINQRPSTEPIDISTTIPGDVVFFYERASHVGVVTGITRDPYGKVVDITFGHTTESKGARVDKIIMPKGRKDGNYWYKKIHSIRVKDKSTDPIRPNKNCDKMRFLSCH